MSFKREGDDPSQLNLLKKRRVAELLANDVPDDEAILMRNGRYACTVCGHRPVFDTVDMLSVHRNGKKHKKCLDYHHARKRSFAQEVLKRKQESELRSQEMGHTSYCQVEAPLLKKTRIDVKNALLKAAPYDSRSKAHQTNTANNAADRNSSGERKDLFFQKMRSQRLQLSQPTSSQSDKNNTTEATPISSLPGNTSSISKPSEKLNISNVTVDTQSSDLSKTKKPNFSSRDEPKLLKLQPYVSKSKRKSCNSQVTTSNQLNPTGPSLSSVPAHKNYKPTDAPWEDWNNIPNISTLGSDVSTSASYSNSHKAVQPKKANQIPNATSSLKQAASWEDSHNIPNISTLGNASSSVSYSQSHKEVQPKKASQIPNASSSLKQTSSYTKEPQTISQSEEEIAQTKVLQELLHKDAKKNAALDQVQQALAGKKTEKPIGGRISSSAHTTTGNDPTMAEQKRRELQHHLQLTSSGWKRDRSGNWIQDEEVEFDSDEETPPDSTVSM